MTLHKSKIGIFALPLLILLLVQLSCKSQILTFRIFEKPITWNAEREELSLQYLKDRHGLDQEEANINPQMVVVHWDCDW